MKINRNQRWSYAVAISLAAITFLGWRGIHNEQEPVQDKRSVTDTLLPIKKSKSKVYRHGRDYQLDEIETAMKQLELIGPTLQKELSGLNVTIANALKEINWKSIQSDVDAALKEANAELKLIDWKKIELEVAQSMKEADKAMKEIDWKGIEKEVSDALAHVKVSEGALKDIDKTVQRAMEEAKKGIEIAKTEVKELRDFVYELDKDGLIDKDGSYEIKVKDHRLIIDGKEQSEEVNKKYERFLKKDDYSISKDKKNKTSI